MVPAENDETPCLYFMSRLNRDAIDETWLLLNGFEQ